MPIILMQVWNELIGFLIIVLVFLVPMISSLLKKKIEVRKKEPSELEESEIIEEVPRKFIPPAPAIWPIPTTERLIKNDYALESEMSDYSLTSDITSRELEMQAAPDFKRKIVSQAFATSPFVKKSRKNVIGRIAKRKDPLKSMVILSEILKEPKSLSSNSKSNINDRKESRYPVE